MVDLNHYSDPEYLKKSILRHLYCTMAKDKYTATKRDYYSALAYAIRDQLVGRWIHTQQAYYDSDQKRVYYLSMEFLIGQTLQNSLINLGIYDNCKKALREIDKDIDSLVDMDADAGLGNGGLGRLAACFLDSMATLKIPGYGYGIRYDYGIFTQMISHGYQLEKPDNWLRYGNPWEIVRSEYLYPVRFYGNVNSYKDENGKYIADWVDTQEVMAMACDTAIPGYENETVNTMRLWQAKSSRGFDLSYFNHGDYIRAVEDVALTENITKVLYPNDNIFEGKELRLKQEYLLVSATLQDILRRYNKAHISLEQLSEKVAIQLNDTHPALAIAEMMRLLVDREELDWEKAWKLTTEIFGYTNHTLLPEALERWSVDLIQKVLPRHLQIIYEINRRWLDKVRAKYPKDINKLRSLSVIEEGAHKTVNMARLAIVGSHRVNGVSALHSELLKKDMFKDFYAIEPEKFTNITNGVTPRRWLKLANPHLSSLISEYIGDSWITHLEDLKKLTPLIEDAAFRKKFQEAKYKNKEHLSKLIFGELEVEIDLFSMFDCQVKRIHEYKRQLLNALHAISLYIRIKEGPKSTEIVPRTIIFGGKAAPGYFMAKLIIKFITSIAAVIDKDKDVASKLKVLFLPNYRVSLAEKLIPAADLSEQISTAGTEASGTGNMKFALNGALTIGTLDGANIEMMEEIGKENMFMFGLTADEVKTLKSKGYYPIDYYRNNPLLKKIVDMIRDGYFSDGDKNLFKPITDSLLLNDPYLIMADFASYVEAQNKVRALYQNHEEWTKKAILNVARIGKFSSDRSISEYASKIWGIK